MRCVTKVIDTSCYRLHTAEMQDERGVALPKLAQSSHLTFGAGRLVGDIDSLDGHGLPSRRRHLAFARRFARVLSRKLAISLGHRITAHSPSDVPRSRIASTDQFSKSPMVAPVERN